ncbi:MAG: peptidase M14 [Zetaproteobacteria bacterium CG12_big_fil_rev_8_21_14_0_65_55_1124]|nr:MAG: peptidase M14 [Zetaproteobacteria bacterium CG1_02_55_237]PIS20156.1 MAG: peptidase M14 [Zetaproteobacteria bacterium CG08_land_8_20_14_0_20_55_17]PIW42721.1 MAG: peptidase M14 [Zetaproteobacteria bacterium CG12_big_fil_rev_8_21_14_0_65_55_1124]PIY53735.1 MAG: peptidase M14 [Zetaproteobacteria bacterium CG_4_10_14_0_8_um_filter_55_43]PIZ38803.1 MAG: peptidase M14 [Zetaproteobacteria bacterium CG_4_10_14_0_2_um_filter_55_20]PJB81430.1 MAG: peptidase M14 [Zetaproteobacteria bacterium CG_
MRLLRLTPLLIAALLPAAAWAADKTAAEGLASTADPVQVTCEKISHKLGSVSLAECLQASLQTTGAWSVQEQPILIKEYPPLGNRTPRARVLMLGGIHGDEYSSVSIVFKWMQTLDRYHSGLFHWRVVPLLNPDGLLQAESSRLNANGIDLNRNFPTPDWYAQTRDYWERRTHKDPRRYPGEAALSEPESRWLYEEIRSFKPDVIVSVHAPYGVLDFDGPPRAPNRMGYLHLNLLGTYPGSLGNCAGVQHRIPVITMELPSAGIMPSDGETSRMWTDLVRWMARNLPKRDTKKAYASFDDIARALNSPLTVRTKAGG